MKQGRLVSGADKFKEHKVSDFIFRTRRSCRIPPRAPVSQFGMFPLTSCDRSLACRLRTPADDITAAETPLPRPAYENNIRSICGSSRITDSPSAFQAASQMGIFRGRPQCCGDSHGCCSLCFSPTPQTPQRSASASLIGGETCSRRRRSSDSRLCALSRSLRASQR